MKVEPYINFDGRCEEALNFYQKAVGAKVEMMMRYKESPQPAPPGSMPPGSENKIMHASVRIGESRINASDGHCKDAKQFHGFSLALRAANDAEAQRCFNALAEGGKITMPLTKTFFSSNFGMLTDRFGMNWMVLVES